MPTVEDDVWNLVVKTFGTDDIDELTKKFTDLQEEFKGLQSVASTVETALTSMTGPIGIAATAIGILVAAGTALYNHWDDLVNYFTEKSPFPKAAEDIGLMNEQLKQARERMADLSKEGTGTAEQLAEYNRLAETTAKLEKEIADQKERQNILDQLKKTAGKEEADRGKRFVTAAAGMDVTAKIAEAYKAEQDEELHQLNVQRERRLNIANASGATDADRIRIMKEEREKLDAFMRMANDPQNDPKKRAEALAIRLAKGDDVAFGALDRLMNTTGVMFGDLKKKMDESDPKTKAALKEWNEGIDAWNKIEQEDARERKQAAADATKAKNQRIQQAVDSSNEIQKAEDDRAKEAAKGAKIRHDMEVKANKAAYGEETAMIKQTGLAEEAEYGLAAAKAGQFGKKAQASPFEFVQQRMQQAIAQRFGMRGQQGADVATRVTAMGQKGLDQRMIGLQGQQLNANQQTQQAMEGALQALQRIANQVTQQNAHAGRMKRGFKQVQDHMGEMQGTAANTG